MRKKINLTGLVSLRTLEKIQDNFAEASGISCVIRDLKGQTLTKFSKPSRLWQTVIKHKETEKLVQEKLLATLDKCLKTGQIEIYQRYLDVYAFVIPIHINDKIIAFFIGGLARTGNPDIQLCTQESQKFGIDLDTYLEMYLELPLVTLEKFEACANLLKIIGSTLSSFAKEESDTKAKMQEVSNRNGILEEKIARDSFKLQESEELYKQLFLTINDGVYIADLQGFIKDANPACAFMLGYSTREELIGKNIRDMYVDPSSRDAFTRELLEKGHIENFQPHLKINNGLPKYLETNATVIKNREGKVIGIQGIVRDISQREHRFISPKATNVTPATSQQNIPNY